MCLLLFSVLCQSQYCKLSSYCQTTIKTTAMTPPQIKRKEIQISKLRSEADLWFLVPWARFPDYAPPEWRTSCRFALFLLSRLPSLAPPSLGALGSCPSRLPLHPPLITILCAFWQCCCQYFFRSRDQYRETLVFRSQDQDRDLGHQVLRPRPGQNELESRDHGLQITTLLLLNISPHSSAIQTISSIYWYQTG